MIFRFLIFLAGMLPLAACTSVGPDYQRPDFQETTHWISQPAEFDTERSVDIAWWKVFGDPRLESYIEQAVEENRNLKAAEARVERALALRRAIYADYGPRIDATAGRTRQRTSRSTDRNDSDSSYRTEYDAGLAASWEIDLFGGVRRAGEAAQARVESEIERRRAVLLALQAEVARNYYAVRGTQKRIANTRANIDLQSRTYSLVEKLYSLGEASEFDLSRARGLLQLTQSRLPELDAEMRASIYRLSVLLGQPPGGLLDEMQQSAPLPDLSDTVPLGQRSDLLRRRPDIRVVERELAAATADIGTVTADLFPRFNLLGNFGRSADTIDGLRSSASTRYLFSSFVRWPIFQSGQIRAEIRAEKAEAVEAAAIYEQTVLEALADAESSLIRYLSQRETQALLRDAVVSRKRAVELARQLFNTGEEDFLSVLDAERELISVEDELAVSETETVLRLVTLYTALGGGWEAFEPEEPAQ